MAPVDPQLAGRLHRLSLIFAAVACTICTLVLIGWYGHIPRFTYVIAGFATMKVNTAFCLLCCSIAMLLRIVIPRRRFAHHFADLVLVVAGTFAGLSLLEYATGQSFGIDQLLMYDPATPLHGYPGRMSVATATAILGTAGGILLLDRATRISQFFILVGSLIALLDLLGYFYGIHSLYSVFFYSSMAIHTSATICLLGAALMTSRPRRCLHHLLISTTLGGRLARRILPATIVVPMAVGWIRLKGQQWGYYDTEFGLALYATSTIIILTSIVWWNALMLDRQEIDRRRIEADRDAVLVREQLARARAEKALLARDQLLAVVSHELRTPLTPALLTATALSHRANLPVDVQEDLTLIHDQIQIEVHLIDDLLDLAGLKQGKVMLKWQDADIHDIARAAAAVESKAIAERQLSLSLELNSLHPMLRCDPPRMKQVITNLLGNAIKFTPAGGTIRIRTSDTPAGDLLIEMIDTGAGFDPDISSRFFEAFEQADPTTTRRFGGLGVGLTIANLLVQLHRGSLTATSQGTDRGACFVVKLPHSSLQAQARPDRVRASILLVDDNTQILWALKRLLESAGYVITTASSGKQAMQLATAQRFDLLISDIGLPDLSGWEVMRRLREQSEADHTRPIRGIAVSGFVDNDDRAKSLAAGFSAHLAKPLSIGELVTAIESVTATPVVVRQNPHAQPLA